MKSTQHPVDQRGKGLSLTEVNISPLGGFFQHFVISSTRSPKGAFMVPVDIRPGAFGFLSGPLCLFLLLCGMSGGVCCTFFISCPQIAPGDLPKAIVNQPLSCLQGTQEPQTEEIVYILFFWFKRGHKQSKQLLVALVQCSFCHTVLSRNLTSRSKAKSDSLKVKQKQSKTTARRLWAQVRWTWWEITHRQ